jgi:hypothetical protein
VGFGLGSLNVVFSDCSGEHCQTSDKVAGAAAFTAIGAGVGALVGTVVRADKWERLQLPRNAASQPVAMTFRSSVPR